MGRQHVPALKHTWPAGQGPQESCPPQPSFHEPHCLPSAAHVVGAQQVLPWQVWPAGQGPQSSCPPHPSDVVPHCAPFAAQVVGEQHWLLWHT
jgi:hypothetical protein